MIAPVKSIKPIKDLSRLLQVGDKGLANGFSRYNS